ARVLLHLNRLSFPNRPHERQPLVHVQPASASGAVSAGYNDDRVSRIYVLLGLDAKVLVDLEDAPQGAARICSNMRPRLHDTADLLPLEVRCDLIGRRTEVALPPAVVDRSHDLHVLVRHRLPPLLGEAFGGSTGLVDVRLGVDGDLDYQAVLPQERPTVPLLDIALAADQTVVRVEDVEGEAIAEVENLLRVELHLVVRREPVLQEGAERRHAIEPADSPAG